MRQSQKDIFKNLQVLLIAACYIFIAVSHIFFLPRLTGPVGKAAVSHNSIFKRKPETIIANAPNTNFFQRTDKFIMNDKKTVIDLLNMVVSSFILLLFARLVWRLKPKYTFNWQWPAANYQYAYISLCTFRI